MEYTVDYFIQKFEQIPEDLWNDDGQYVCGEKKCALGHCGIDNFKTNSPEEGALVQILPFNIAMLNDGSVGDYLKYGSTPKQRILNALKEIKLNQPEVTDQNTLGEV